MTRVLLLAALCTPEAAWAWGETGHRAIGALAARHLDRDAAREVIALLPGAVDRPPRRLQDVRRAAELPLADASTWPDEARNIDGWSGLTPLHYVTVLPGTSYGAATSPRGDAMVAIAAYQQILGDRSQSEARRRLALRMLVHVIGDVHQPLHTGRGCDRGGNQVAVSWFGEETNLHRVWDEHVVDDLRFAYTELADRLDADPVAVDTNVDPSGWIEENQPLLDALYRAAPPEGAVACDDGLVTFGGCSPSDCAVEAGAVVTLRYAYRARARIVVRARMRDAGRRLAALLNWTIGRGDEPDAWRSWRADLSSRDAWDAAIEACKGP